MNVLSLFDGISCARIGLERAGIQINSYYAIEIDKHASKVSQTNYPDIVRPVNDVRFLSACMLPEIDLLIGGSPCQDLSIAKKERKGLEGDRSGLFWEYIRILREVKPKYFVLENVASMPKKDRDIITKEMGVEPVLFNASLVSAQCRKRLFWTNIQFELPDDRGIVLKDILQPDGEVDDRMITKDGKAYCLTTRYSSAVAENSIERKQRTMVKIGRDVGRRLQDGVRKDNDTSIPITRRMEIRDDNKCGTLTSVSKDNQVVNLETNSIRKLTPIECERLQGVPDDYTSMVSNTQRYKCLGNAFNCDVIAHILQYLLLKNEENEIEKME